jgi:hypothetical protein
MSVILFIVHCAEFLQTQCSEKCICSCQQMWGEGCSSGVGSVRRSWSVSCPVTDRLETFSPLYLVAEVPNFQNVFVEPEESRQCSK